MSKEGANTAPLRGIFDVHPPSAGSGRAGGTAAPQRARF